MNYQIYQIRNGKRTNISKAIGNLTWSDSIDSLGMEFSFDLPHSYFDEQFKGRLYNGDTILVTNNGKELFRGMITSVPLEGGTYSGYDYAYYLNKSETVIQFNKISASKAIRKLCDRYDVPIGTMPNLATLINKTYKDEVVADVLTDILKKVKNETGKGYRMEMSKGKLNIIQDGYIKVKPTYEDKTGRILSCTKSCNITGTRSIEELRNKVIVAGTDEKKTQIKATAKSDTSIEKYGLLTEVETQDDINEAKARNIAKNKLASLNKVIVSFTAEMVGNNVVRASRMVYFDRPEVGIKGWYKCKSCTHTLNKGLHMMSCEMENY